MIYKLTQLLLMLSIGLSPLLNAMASGAQINPPASANYGKNTVFTVLEQSDQAHCCKNPSSAICTPASECCGHCFAAIITLYSDIVLAAQAPYVYQTQTQSNGVKTEPLIRPPKS